jgi:hypothetical protein
MDNLTNSNFLLWTAARYDHSQRHTTEEFFEDVRRIKYIKKLVTKYVETGELKERLILNHLIILCNVFGPESLCKILFLKMQKQMVYLKPFLVLLNILKDKVVGVGDGKPIDTTVIAMDPTIIAALRKLVN